VIKGRKGGKGRGKENGGRRERLSERTWSERTLQKRANTEREVGMGYGMEKKSRE
jgi:hypothetical protein